MNRRQRRRRALVVRSLILGPIALLAAAGVVGLVLSPIHRQVTRRVYPTSPETVWGALTDLDGMPTWRQDLVALERLPGEGETVRWRETGTDGAAVTYQRIEAEPPAKLVVELALVEAGRRRWEYRIRPVDSGTELSVQEERSFRNPIVRPFVRLFGSDRGRIEAFARDLADRLKGHRQRIATAINR